MSQAKIIVYTGSRLMARITVKDFICFNTLAAAINGNAVQTEAKINSQNQSLTWELIIELVYVSPIKTKGPKNKKPPSIS